MDFLLRRKRLPDGSFGELEKVFEGETDAEKIARLEEENLTTLLALTELYEQLLAKQGGGA